MEEGDAVMKQEMKASIQVKPRAALAQITPYSPGKSIDEVQQEFGLERVVKLASNENSLGPSPKAVQAIQTQLMQLHRYPDKRSIRLVDGLAQAFDFSPEQIVITNGGDELIVLISQAFIEPGDEIVIPVPTFSEYEFGANLMSASLVKVPLTEDFAYAVDDLLSAVTEKTKLLSLCSPNNPTGTYLPESEMRRLLENLPERVLVMVDAAYSHYAGEVSDYSDGTKFIREGYPVISLFTFSKIYGLAGIRVGYGVAAPDIIAALLKVKGPFNVNALAETAALAALSDEEHIQASLQMNGAGRKQLYEGFRQLKLAYTESLSNFILVELGEETPHLFQKLLERGVIVREAKAWGYPGHIRVSIGTMEENEVFLQTLKDILEESDF